MAPSVFGIGNPLLDIIANVPLKFMQKYDIKPGDFCFLGPKQLGMYADMKKSYPVKMVPGGATQNSIRVCQALLGEPQATAFVGCIGNDENGVELETLMDKAEVSTRYSVVAEVPTGVCGVCVHEKERSLCTTLGASEKFPLSHIFEPSVWELVEKSRIIYSGGYFITVRPEALEMIASHCQENDKIYGWNLAAPFLIENFFEGMVRNIESSNLLFGNETEFLCMAAKLGFVEKDAKDPDLPQLALRFAQFKNSNPRRAKIVVITSGAEPTVVATDFSIVGADASASIPKGQSPNYSVRSFPVQALKPEEIEDTNAAGDAFVGGFLAGLATAASVEKCVALGHAAAAHVVKRVGCQIDFANDASVRAILNFGGLKENHTPKN